MPVDQQGELDAMRRALLTMGAEVEHRMKIAISALITEDMGAIDFVLDGDDEIDQMELAIEQDGLRILALSQPFATDLRMILATMRIGGLYERVGDLARGVAKRAVDLQKYKSIDETEPFRLPKPLVSMAVASLEMLVDVNRALADLEINLARSIREADDRVDDLQKEIFVWAQHEIPKHVDWTSAAIDILSVARKLERIADLSTNIAEEIIFLVDGSIVRHT